jgi:hypothetical protein
MDPRLTKERNSTPAPERLSGFLFGLGEAGAEVGYFLPAKGLQFAARTTASSPLANSSEAATAAERAHDSQGAIERTLRASCFEMLRAGSIQAVESVRAYMMVSGFA